MHIQSLRAKHDKNSVIEANGLIFRSQRYFIGGAVVVGENISYNFGKIEKIYLLDGIPFIFCEILGIETFDAHIHAFRVKRTGQFQLVKVRELYDYHALGIYSLRGSFYIPLRHHIS